MLDSLEARLDDVRTLCELRGIDPTSAEHRPTLQRIDVSLTELEEAMSAARTAVAAEAEGRGAAEVGWSLEQVATCVVASPREGAPEADAALRAAIAAAAACRHVDTSALLPPCYRPGMTLV